MRRRQRALVSDLTPTARRREAEANADAVEAMLADRGRPPLAAFVAMAHELDTRPLLRRLWTDGREVWLPRIVGPRRMVWYAVGAEESLEPGTFGILEPDPRRARQADVPVEAVVLVPGLAFTRSGARLGQGGGFYDAFLHRVRRPTIGWCFSRQMCEELPEAPHDRRMDMLCCDGQVLGCRVVGDAGRELHRVDRHPG